MIDRTVRKLIEQVIPRRVGNVSQGKKSLEDLRQEALELCRECTKIGISFSEVISELSQFNKRLAGVI